MDRKAPLSETLDRLRAKKSRLDSLRPLPPEAVRNLKEFLEVHWTHHSTAIEGNTLTESETRAVLLDGITIAGKSLREHLEVVNHRAAIVRVEALANTRQPLTEATVWELHGIILRGIDDAQAGQYRTINGRIAGSRHEPPDFRQVPLLMAEFGAWLGNAETQLLQEPDVFHPVEMAAQAHWRLAHIHPFTDGNGRTARLIMNLLLLRQGYPPAVLRQEERPIYYAALETADLTGEKELLTALIAAAAERSLDLWLRAMDG